MFRPLEEPDKLRSLNLNGFYIDEANQVSEEAFLLLQGRLRGKHVRKGILTQNTGGHDFAWRWFVDKRMHKNEESKKDYYNIVAPSSENVHLPDGYVQSMLDTWSDERIQREIYANEDQFEGMIYNEFKRDTHVVKPFVIPKEWTRIIGWDHGYTNPTAILWGAVDYDNNIYIYKEFYKREWLIKEICLGRQDTGEKGIIQLNFNEKLEGVYIDPSTKATRSQTGDSDFTAILELLPKTWPLIPANNEVNVGIDRVKTYLKPNVRTNKPKLFIFESCENLIAEISEYRWQELGSGQTGRLNEKEKPRKYNDHACFVGDTLVETRLGPKRIQDIKVGDRVLTSLGYRRVLSSGSVGSKPVYDYGWVQSTSDHPILLANGTKKAIHDLTDYDTLSTLFECRSSLMALYLGKLADIIELTARTVKTVLKPYIERFENYIRDPFKLDSIYIMSTTIPTITLLPILDLLKAKFISQNIQDQNMPFVRLNKEKNISQISDLSQKNGTLHQKVDNGIGNTLSELLRKGLNYLRSGTPAKFVQKHSWLKENSISKAGSVIKIVKQGRYVGVEQVYNLSIEGVSEFYANGVLVSNCDALRYMLMSRPDAPIVKAKAQEWQTMESSLQAEISSIKKPKEKDPFSGII